MIFGLFLIVMSVVVLTMAAIQIRSGTKFWAQCSYTQAKLVGVRQIQNSPKDIPIVCFEYEGRQITASMQPIPEKRFPNAGDLIEVAYLKENIFQHETWTVKEAHDGKRKDKIFQVILLSAGGILLCIGLCLLTYEMWF